MSVKLLIKFIMFSGIVEEAAVLVDVKHYDGNVDLTFKCSFVNELSIDQSISHNGVCLTVVSLPNDGTYKVTAISETLQRSNLGLLQPGDMVNIERSMRLDGRLDGHIVQGHVDTTAECIEVAEENGSHRFKFRYNIDKEMMLRGYMTVEKGSVTVNGVSLTVCDSKIDGFSVAIIPYTYENTNFNKIKRGSIVNLEFDILGKYLARLTSISEHIK